MKKTEPSISYPMAFLAFGLAWLILSWPWLSGEVTIPYDAKAHFFAQIQFLANAIHSGQSPFWTPNEFAGSPQIADPQSLIFSPAILLALFSAHPSFFLVDAYVLVFLGCGSLAVMLFFRDRDWHPISAVVAGLVFCFGASASWRIQHIGQIQSYALFPICLWLVSRTLSSRSNVWGISTGLVGGLMMMEADQIVLLADYALVGFVIATIVGSEGGWRQARFQVPALAAAGAVGTIIAVLPMLMTYLFVEDSNRPMIALAEASHGSLHPASLLTAVISDLYGAFDPKVDYWGPYSMSWNPNDLTLSQNMGEVYVGALPILLLITTGLIGGKAWARDVRYFTICLALSIIYALGTFTPVFHLLYNVVPGVDLFRRPADATFMIGAFLAYVTGYLTHRLLADGQQGTSVREVATGAGLVVGLFFLGLGIAARFGHFNDAIKPTAVSLGLAVAAALLLWLVGLHGRQYAVASLAAVTAFLTCDLRASNGPNESTALPVAQYEFMKPNCKNETIRFLKSQLQRAPNSPRHDRVEVVGMGFSWGNVGLIHGFDHLMGYNPLRLDVIPKSIGARDNIASWDDRTFTPLFPSYRSLMADMLGLRYIATPVPIECVDRKLKPGDLQLAARTSDAYIYENPRAFPRVMFVPNWERADFGELIRTGAWPSFDPKQTLLLEHLPIEPARSDEGAPASTDGAATITHFENTIVDVDVDAPRSGFLLFNSVWHPWWRATIDGQPTEILKANVLFRAVQVPVGQHHVHFEFDAVSGAISELIRHGDTHSGAEALPLRRSPHV